MPIILQYYLIKTIKNIKTYEYIVNLVLFKNIIHIRDLLKGGGSALRYLISI